MSRVSLKTEAKGAVAVVAGATVPLYKNGHRVDVPPDQAVVLQTDGWQTYELDLPTLGREAAVWLTALSDACGQFVIDTEEQRTVDTQAAAALAAMQKAATEANQAVQKLIQAAFDKYPVRGG